VIQPQGWLPPDAGEVERRARLLSTALARIGVTAFSPGERDLTIGPALLQRLLRKAKVPTVSANLFDTHGRRLFDADRMVDLARPPGKPGGWPRAIRWRRRAMRSPHCARAARK
jgi:2',3'-cyclic-nucleotide 2'-phosphodiesterase (5'-nucleotidase family)